METVIKLIVIVLGAPFWLALGAIRLIRDLWKEGV